MTTRASSTSPSLDLPGAGDAPAGDTPAGDASDRNGCVTASECGGVATLELDTIPAVVVVLDPVLDADGALVDLVIVALNEAARATDPDGGAAPGGSYAELYPDAPVWEMAHAALAGEGVQHRVVDYTTPSGTTGTYDALVSVQDGRVVLTSLDVTEVLAARRQREALAEQTVRTLEVLPVTIIIYRPEFTEAGELAELVVEHANAAARAGARMLQVDPPLPEGSTLTETCPGAPVWEMATAVLAGGGVQHRVLELPLPDGATGSYGVFVDDAAGAVVVTVLDLTAVLAAERERAATEEFHLRTLDLLPATVAVLDPTIEEDGSISELTVVYVNAAGRASDPEVDLSPGVRFSEAYPGYPLWALAQAALDTGEGQREVVTFDFEGTSRTFDTHVELSAGRVVMTSVEVTAALVAERERLGALEFHRTVVDHLAEGLVITDTEGTIVEVNPAAAELLRISAEELVGMRPLDGLDEVDDADGHPLAEHEMWVVRAARENRAIEGEHRIVLADGTQTWVDVRTRPLTLADGRAGGVATFTDVTERRRAREALVRSESELRTLVRGLASAVALYAPVCDEGEVVGLRLVYANDRASAVLDAERVAEQFTLAARQALAGEESTVELEDPDGFEAQLVAVGEYVVVTLADRRAERAERAELSFRASHWPGTELLNRTALDEVVGSLLAGPAQRSFAVVLVELSGVDELRRGLGYDSGDAVTDAVGERLAGWAAGPERWCAQLSASTFVAVVDGIARVADAATAAAEVLDAVGDTVVADGVPLVVERAAGVVLGPLHGEDAGALLRRAKVAAHAAANRGGGHRVWEPHIDEDRTERLALLGQFAEALAGGALSLEYHPRVSTSEGGVVAWEAVARWAHPERGRLPARLFVPAIARTPLLVPYLEWLLHQSLAEAREFLKGARLAVSFPGAALELGGVEDVVADALIAAGRPGSVLEIDLPESSAADWDDDALERLRALADNGVCVGLDEAGGGLATITLMRRAPVGLLRVDRSLVRGVASDRRSQAWLGALGTLAADLPHKVVATGVETSEELRTVTKLGCAAAQGFYFTKPLSASTLSARGGWAPSPDDSARGTRGGRPRR